MHTLSDLGEQDLIARIARAAGSSRRPGVVLGIGDDAAVLRTRAAEDFVISTDATVEDVHFRWSTHAGRNVGRRALVSNLSDLAAMGARPVGFVLALSAPASLTVTRFDGLISGLLAEARDHGCPLVGGNLSSARQTVLSITVFGAVPRGVALRRDALRPGDRLYVTGTLGGAALALARSERAGSRMRGCPVARLEAGRALLRLQGHGACIDLSDGLVPDLERLLRASRVGAELRPDCVPVPRGFSSACGRLGLDPRRLSLAGGEDYELLFSVRARTATRLSPRALSGRLGVPVSEIGQVTSGKGIAGLPEFEGYRHY
ncbi:MAG: thiamine-phosphate kinase [Myxococcota bacterium]